jgi:hypothetical protein
LAKQHAMKEIFYCKNQALFRKILCVGTAIFSTAKRTILQKSSTNF